MGGREEGGRREWVGDALALGPPRPSIPQLAPTHSDTHPPVLEPLLLDARLVQHVHISSHLDAEGKGGAGWMAGVEEGRPADSE